MTTPKAPPKWEDVSAHHGAVAWKLTKTGIASRARKVRYLWDLRWHEENRAVAQGDADLQQHHCLICRRGLGTQAHILCECPALSQVRLSNHIDFNRAARRLLHFCPTTTVPGPPSTAPPRPTRLWVHVAPPPSDYVAGHSPPPPQDGTGTPRPHPPHATRDYWDSRLGEDHG